MFNLTVIVTVGWALDSDPLCLRSDNEGSLMNQSDTAMGGHKNFNVVACDALSSRVKSTEKSLFCAAGFDYVQTNMT